MIGMGRKMELARKERLTEMNICRFCLTSKSDLHSLYEDPTPNNKLHMQILSCLSVEVFPSDHMPRFICDRCKIFMNTFFSYKQICRQADETIMKHIQKGTPLKTISFPPDLNDVFSKEVKCQTGTTVQVSLQDGSDSEEDIEDNVYNIKMEMETAEDGAQVTVIPNQDNNKNLQTPGQTNHRFPCNFCDRVFVRYAHFIRHVESKHHQACDQCGEKFVSQDDLIYHSAIHATQNLTCPLCMEKFENVDDVTSHIKSHVNASEYVCDFCELVFMSRDKLDAHLVASHKAELQHSKQDIDLDESSMENRGEDDDDEDNGIRVKQVGDDMVVEINKPESFMLNNSQDELEKGNNFSEDSEADSNHPDTPSDVAVITKLPGTANQREPSNVLQNIKLQDRDAQNIGILKKAEEIKRKTLQKPMESAADRKQKPVAKPDNVMSASNDKSLRLLEKELQELKRTNTKAADVIKASGKSLESMRSRRPQLATSTPKPKPVEERKTVTKPQATVEKKPPEKRVVTKENKEPKDIKNNDKELKDKEEEKEELERDKKARKEVEKDSKETPKNAFKNGASEKEKAEEVIRRSNRPSKIKDYAKLVRDKPQNEEDDSEEDDDDEEYIEETTSETKKRRSSQKGTVRPTPTRQPAAAINTSVGRKRGRPRKEFLTPAKLKKDDANESEEMDTSQSEKEAKSEVEDRNVTPDIPVSPEIKPDPKPLLVSPSGQTLKQVSMKSLPPGVKPLPLPPNARQVGASEVCEMQIGKKVVKVQKIMMTKAEVEAMAKKGLLEYKDGTMVLKQGIKLPTAVDSATIKTSLVGDAVTNKESLKKDAAPTRCDTEEFS